jgi:hypothetical protein
MCARAEVHHPSSLAERGQERAREQVVPEKVRPERQLEPIAGGAARAPDTRVVHEHIDAGPLERLRCAAHRRQIREVELHVTRRAMAR